MPRPEIPGQTRSSFTVTARGTGRPDYSEEVHLGTVLPGIQLHYGESLLAFMLGFSAIPSAYSWMQTPLASGATLNFINAATGLSLPYIIPVGYTMSQVQYAAGFNEDFEADLYLAYQLFASSRIGGGVPQMEASVIAFDSALIDPTGALGLPFDLQLTNVGLGDLVGSCGYNMILKAVGTPPLPTVKTVRCKWCGAQKEVPVETIMLTCDSCGQVTIYYR